MKKRGISAIVATVLIILLTVAAVGILWAAIIPMIQNNLDFSSLEGRVSVLTSNGYTYYDAVEQKASVQVKRDVDEGVMDRILIVMDFNGSSISSLVVAPNSGSTKVYVFDVSGYGEPDSVSVAPVFVTSSGREKEGELTSEGFFGVGDVDVSSLKSPVYVIGREYEGEIPLDGLVSWWKLDGDFSDVVGDNDGIGQGDARIEDEVLVLDGNGDWVLIPQINITDAVTVGAWFYRDQKDTVLGDTVFGGWKWDSNLQNQEGFDAIRFFQLSPNKLENVFVVEDSSNFKTNVDVSMDLGESQFGRWIHAVVVFDSVEGFARLYINGTLVSNVSSNIQSKTIVPLTSPNMGIGYSGTNTAYFNGKIDNVMLYDRALSDEEVGYIYETQR